MPKLTSAKFVEKHKHKVSCIEFSFVAYARYQQALRSLRAKRGAVPPSPNPPATPNSVITSLASVEKVGGDYAIHFVNGIHVLLFSDPNEAKRLASTLEARSRYGSLLKNCEKAYSLSLDDKRHKALELKYCSKPTHQR